MTLDCRLPQGLRMVGTVFCVLSAAASLHAADASNLNHAWSSFRMGEFNVAGKEFKALADANPQGSPQNIAALYGMASALNLRQPDPDKAAAADIFRKIVELAPDSELAVWSALALVRQRHLCASSETPDFAQLHKDYWAVYEKSPDSLPGQEAFLYSQAVRIVKPEKSTPEEVKKAVKDFLARHTGTKFESSAWMLAAQCDKIDKNPEGMLASTLKSLETVEINPKNPDMRPIDLWNAAVVAEFSMGDFEKARALYRKLIQEAPNDQRVFGAKTALNRMDEVERRIKAGKPITSLTLTGKEAARE